MSSDETKEDLLLLSLVEFLLYTFFALVPSCTTWKQIKKFNFSRGRCGRNVCGQTDRHVGESERKVEANGVQSGCLLWFSRVRHSPAPQGGTQRLETTHCTLISWTAVVLVEQIAFLIHFWWELVVEMSHLRQKNLEVLNVFLAGLACSSPKLSCRIVTHPPHYRHKSSTAAADAQQDGRGPHENCWREAQ